MIGWDTSELVAFIGCALCAVAMVLFITAEKPPPDNEEED